MKRAELVAWVGTHVLPHEADVRAWLKRRVRSQASVDDVVQETYCRIAALDDVSHIKDGRAYFFRAASNILIEQIRHARIVHIDSVAEMESLNVVDDVPTPDRIVAGRHDLLRVKALIASLPQRCREVFELRRIHGLSQREVAERLGISENVVEHQSMRGLRLILKALTEEESSPAPTSSRLTRWYEHRNRARNR